MKGNVSRPYYDHEGRKYIDLDQFRIKIPYRYGRVMCKVFGIRTIQEFELGESVDFEYEIKVWEGLRYMVLKSICSSSS
jgi:hypothetical protein